MRTLYTLVGSSRDGRRSVLIVTTTTGLSQHVLAHLAHAGLPVVGDPFAGVAEGKQASASPPPFAPRLGLHLVRVELPHPVTGHMVVAAAQPPALFGDVESGLPELALAAQQRPLRRLKPADWGGGSGSALGRLAGLAAARRAPLAAAGDTDVYRLINGPADGLPGLAVDRYGDALVLNLYDEAEQSAPRPVPLAAGLIEAVAGAVAGPAGAVYVKYRHREAAAVDEEALPALAPTAPALGTGPGEFAVREDGLAYVVRPGEGWNPGIFPDMREMRGRVRARAAGKRVLNCFAYTCAFGVAALAGGAHRVVNVDLSWPALERGRANYRANGFAPEPDGFLYGDVFDVLPELARRRQLFDIIILDPPGFARSKTHVWSAAHDYARLVQAAAPLLAPDGLLVACCNVAGLSWDRFRSRVAAGLDAAWRAAGEVQAYGAPALDFPLPPGQEGYLKVLVASVK